ncbi:MAG: translation elongation factor 4 [Desulfobacteraceae bacterium]|nr:translation elongation factor 4 [Desulfobacteraceae bacterium]
MKYKAENIRNFSIIAHIDHGKSTLSDRMIQISEIVSDRDFQDQILDTMDIERERGITIKSQTVSLPYKADDGKTYLLNLIDTPGHVDFTYEVSRALAACEGALVIVDASQGVEAQTLANIYLAMEHDLEIIPVINKIDLPSAEIEWARNQITEDLGLDGDAALLVSAKNGIGIEEVFKTIVNEIPAPAENSDKPLKALVFDSHYDSYRGIIIHLRVFQGTIKPGDKIMFMSNGAEYTIEETGLFQIERKPQAELFAGQVGYIIAGIKVISDVKIGDTITLKKNQCDVPESGFKEPNSVVFSSIYPVASDEYEELTEALGRLKLNDASLAYEKDSSAALGFGYRCGFLGLLHLEVVQERLEREYNISLILTAPSVKYEIKKTDGEVIIIDNPSFCPDPAEIDTVKEPYIKATIIVPDKYMGNVMQLCYENRGESKNYQYLTSSRVEMKFELPLAEVIYEFYDHLKSVTQGYGSFDYEIIGYQKTDLVKLDFLVNHERVDALSRLIHRDKAEARARIACKKLKDEIPRQMFKVPIQAAIGGKIIARETVNAFRKDVTAKCYGGDISRKRKLLEKQKKGKKRMKMAGKVPIPQSAFLSVLKSDN